jgi:mannose/cellobiose epimerase-like protein (N-acyl-D-glucosamine 2-epimerase family)
MHQLRLRAIVPVIAAGLLALSACGPATLTPSPKALELTRAAKLPTPTAYVYKTATPAGIAARMATSEDWLAYFNTSLLPYWSHPDAFGEPVGSFPSVRCNDGKKVDRAKPCPEVKKNDWLMQNTQHVVAVSRQTYGYCVAFHLTGDVKYLRLAKAGADYIRNNAFDRKNGGIAHVFNRDAQRWEPEPGFRDPQQLAYGLQGIAMYYYITRDPEVLPDILAVQRYIMDAYRRDTKNALVWHLEGEQSETLKLTAQLDQLNAYMLMMDPLLPPDVQKSWRADMLSLTKSMRDLFYAPEDNLFFLTATKPEEIGTKNADTDFGHTIKSFWMMRFVGIAVGDDAMVEFAEEHGLRVLERAYDVGPGAWVSGINKGGAVNRAKEWWIYNELDQFTATMAMSEPDHALAKQYLPRTNAYWFARFVRPEGEAYSSVKADGTPDTFWPTAWPWKNAYHTFEHAMIGYLSASMFEGKPATLHYAFVAEPPRDSIRPYLYRGTLADLKTAAPVDGVTVYTATWRDIK